MSKTKTIAIFRDDALNKEANILVKRLRKYNNILKETDRKTDAGQNTISRVQVGAQLVNEMLIELMANNPDKLINNNLIS